MKKKRKNKKKINYNNFDGVMYDQMYDDMQPYYPDMKWYTAILLLIITLIVLPFFLLILGYILIRDWFMGLPEE